MVQKRRCPKSQLEIELCTRVALTNFVSINERLDLVEMP